MEGIVYDFSVFVFIGAIWTFTYKNVCGMSVASCRLNLTPSTEDSLAHGGPVTFFADIKQEMHVVKSAVTVMQTLLGDGINFSSANLNV